MLNDELPFGCIRSERIKVDEGWTMKLKRNYNIQTATMQISGYKALQENKKSGISTQKQAHQKSNIFLPWYCQFLSTPMTPLLIVET